MTDPARLFPMDLLIPDEPIRIDLVYADASHPRNIFEEALYHNTTRLWLYDDLAAIVLLTARSLNIRQGWILALKDGLRTTNAQQKMQETSIVRQHPEWCRPGPERLLSPPGKGAHPRGMAIDVGVLDNDGRSVDMGTPFDFMGPESARHYKDLPSNILKNRQILQQTFEESAHILNLPLLPIPSEWWDFRFPPDVTDEYAPLSDSDLPPQMQMVSITQSAISDFPDSHFEAIKTRIQNALS